MLSILTRSKYRDPLLATALLCAAAGLMLYPKQSIQAAQQGLTLCANVIVPSLFPFFVLSSLVVELGMAGYLGRALERVMMQRSRDLTVSFALPSRQARCTTDAARAL